jgi:5-methylcytosine-specific restriction endonuclease McrA
MEEKTIMFTKQMLESGKSINNGWSNAQVKVLGETPHKKGWAKRLIGRMITPSQLKQFLDLKDAHLSEFKKEFLTTGVKPESKFPQKQKKPKNRPKETLKKPEFYPVSGHMTLQDQYRHPNWQIMKSTILTRDGFACINCGSTANTLHVHHLKYGYTYVWDVPVWYLVTLCDACHSEEHGKDLRMH